MVKRMDIEKGIILEDGRLITTFKELEGEFLKIGSEYKFTDNALRRAKEEIVRLQSKLETDTKQLKVEIEWLKQMNKGLVELSMEVLRWCEDEKQCDY